MGKTLMAYFMTDGMVYVGENKEFSQEEGSIRLDNFMIISTSELARNKSEIAGNITRKYLEQETLSSIILNLEKKVAEMHIPF